MAFSIAHSAIARALSERNYNDATPVQEAVLKPDAEGRDLLVSAQTGSGKTIAYGLAMAETLLEGAEAMGPAGEPLALIIAPTRELALQVQRELAWLYHYAGARVVSCVGGMDPGRERRELADGAHIVVGTPGRLRDHLERRALKVSSLKAVVLDEADEMLDMGFREDLQFILETAPAERRTLLFSATLPKAIVTLATHYQRDALRIATVGEARGHADIEYRAIRVSHHKVEHAVVNLLRFLDPPGALVFCNTRNAVRHLEAALLERGFTAVSLSGELSQSERNHALQSLRDGRARVCVATDVAARGIDLPSLSLVIHADLPNDAEVLQHRSGRTGRAGKKGISILLVPPARRRRAEEMLGRARVNVVWGDPPSVEAIRKLDRERLLENPIFTENATDEELAAADAILGRHSPRDVAAAFVKLYGNRLPAPEELGEDFSPRPHRKTEQGDHKPRSQTSREESPSEHGGHNKPHQKVPASTRKSPPSSMENGVWFRVNVGRERKADPKWLLPEICRQGDVSKKDVGAIRVFDLETLFQIEAGKAQDFETLAATRKKGGIRITRAPDQSGEPATPRGAAPNSPGDSRPPKKHTGHPKRKFGGAKKTAH